MEIITKIYEYLQYPFVLNALLVGIFISLAAALVGVILVLKRFSYIGDGLSHVAFGGLVVASILNLSQSMPFVLVITTICAIFLLTKPQDAKIHGDARLAMFSVGTMAIGYLLLHLFKPSGNIAGDVCTTLFGSTSILTLGTSDTYLCIILSLFVVVTFIINYQKIFIITMDEHFAIALKMNVRKYQLFLAIITSIIIVVAMRLVGSLLITALVIFPALASMQVFKSFKAVMISAAIFGSTSAFIGVLISIVASTPVGSTIVVFEILLYFVFAIIGHYRTGS